MSCSKCGKKTKADSIFGVSPYCESCQNALTSFRTKVPEFAGEKIKEQREMYHEDIEQPHYKGNLNKAWLEGKYGGKKRAKNMGFSDKEIKNAEYVYTGNVGESYYKKYN